MDQRGYQDAAAVLALRLRREAMALPEDRQALAEELKPRIVVPMHYRSDTFGYEVISGVEDFLSLRSDVVRYPGNTMEIVPGTPAQTAVLTYLP